MPEKLKFVTEVVKTASFLKPGDMIIKYVSENNYCGKATIRRTYLEVLSIGEKSVLVNNHRVIQGIDRHFNYVGKQYLKRFDKYDNEVVFLVETTSDGKTDEVLEDIEQIKLMIRTMKLGGSDWPAFANTLQKLYNFETLEPNETKPNPV